MNSLVWFEKVEGRSFRPPCVDDGVVQWHVQNGWVWNVYGGADLRPVGVFFCTLLCGDGVICHFTPRPEIRIPWHVTLAAFRKGVRMLAPVCDVIYATIPAEKEKLIRVVIRLGFGIVEEGGFLRDGRTPVVLLKYYGHGSQSGADTAGGEVGRVGPVGRVGHGTVQPGNNIEA